MVPHHKISDKKQGSDSIGGISSSSSSDTKRSNHSTKGNSKNNDKNNNQGTDHGSHTSADLSPVEPAKSGEQQQQRESGSVAPTLGTTCEQGSNCTDQ